LSYSFQNDQDPLIHAVRAIIECAGFRLVDGKILDGHLVSPQVLKKMTGCKGVVCVVTPEAIATGWVSAEYFQAVGAGVERIFVLCDDNVQLPNPYQGTIVSRFSAANALQGITTLAATLGMWKQTLGVSVRAVLLPDDIGRKAHQENAKCEYRCEEMSSFEESEWRDARLKPIDAAVHAILPEVPLNHSLQVRVTFNNGQFFTSSFIPQDLRLELQQ
jgi:hypothetical protein